MAAHPTQAHRCRRLQPLAPFRRATEVLLKDDDQPRLVDGDGGRHSAGGRPKASVGARPECREACDRVESATGPEQAASSVWAAAGVNGRSVYCATKAGVNGLTRAAAIEYARDEIRVNSVLPGTTDAPMIHRSDDERRSERTKLNATDAMDGRGNPEQVAEAVLFLGSDMSDRITGVELPVDGGFLASP